MTLFTVQVVTVVPTTYSAGVRFDEKKKMLVAEGFMR